MVIQFLGYMSILTNVGVLYFTLDGNLGGQWWTSLTGGTTLGRLVGMIIIEHILVTVKVMLSAIIQDEPAWVMDAKKRAYHTRKIREEIKRLPVWHVATPVVHA